MRALTSQINAIVATIMTMAKAASAASILTKFVAKDYPCGAKQLNSYYFEDILGAK